MDVHPAAAVFPMLPDDELDALAADIAANGLRHPIVRTPDGQLLDGRNRFKACQRVGVTPDVETYEGDPVAYVLSANNHRRHLSKGQKAMAGVLALNNHYSTQREDAAAIGVSQALVMQARTVAEHTPDRVQTVLAGAESLREAYDQAVRARDAAATAEERFARLPEDLADLVREERMDLAEAEAVAIERERRIADERRDARGLLIRVLDLIAPEQPSLDFTESWAAHLGPVEPMLAARLDGAIDVLSDLSKRVRA